MPLSAADPSVLDVDERKPSNTLGHVTTSGLLSVLCTASSAGLFAAGEMSAVLARRQIGGVNLHGSHQIMHYQESCWRMSPLGHERCIPKPWVIRRLTYRLPEWSSPWIQITEHCQVRAGHLAR